MQPLTVEASGPKRKMLRAAVLLHGCFVRASLLLRYCFVTARFNPGRHAGSSRMPPYGCLGLPNDCLVARLSDALLPTWQHHFRL